MKRKNEFAAELSNLQGGSILQFATTISLCFSQLGTGSLLSWSSPSLQHLMSEKSEFPVTLKQGAWITSLSSIGLIIGCFVISFLMDRIGRKSTLLIFAIPQIASWILITFAKNVFTLCMARVIDGIGYSCAGLISIYLAEIAEQRIRGMLSIFIVISCEIGMFMVAMMGAYLPYHTMNSILVLVPFMYFVSFIFMPESPYFYLIKQQDEKAAESLVRLRGVKTPELIAREIEKMKKDANEEQCSRKSIWRELFANKSSRKGFVIVICAHLTSMLSGTLVVITYAQQIFHLSGFSLTPEHSFMLLTFVKIISGLVASQLIESLGRRFLYLTSGIFCSLSLGFVSLSFFLKDHLHIDSNFLNLCPLISLISYEIVSTLGISCLPFVFGGELFLISVKKLAITIVFIATAVTSFGVELIFPILSEAIGVYVSFLIFSTFCLVGTLFNFFIMPETKGQSLEEIQVLLNPRRNEDREVRSRLLSRTVNKYGVGS